MQAVCFKVVGNDTPYRVSNITLWLMHTLLNHAVCYACLFQSAAKLQLETEREKNEQLQLEIQGWETDVRRLETELNILKVRIKVCVYLYVFLFPNNVTLEIE